MRRRQRRRGDGCTQDCGTSLWTTTSDVGTRDGGFGVDIDPAGDVLVVAGVGNGGGTLELWIAKLSRSGDELWSHVFDPIDGFVDDWDGGADIASDPDGNAVVVASVFQDDRFYAWLRKYDPDGGELWTQTWGPEDGSAQGTAVAVDEDGNVFAAGYARGNGWDVWIGAYDADGNERWTRTWDGAGTDDFGHGIAVDRSGNVVVTGDTNFQFWLGKFDATGVEVWVQSLPDEDHDGSGDAVAIDVDDGIYVTGWAHGELFAIELFAAALDSEGDMRWSSVRPDANGNGIALDPRGGVIVCGSAQSNALLLAYDSDGAESWSQPVEEGWYYADVAVGPKGHMVVTGSLQVEERNRDVWIRAYGAVP